MKLAFIIYGELSKITGGYIYDKHVVQYLERAGHDVQIFSLPDTSYWKSIPHNFRKDFRNNLNGQAFDFILQDELCHPSLFHLNRRLNAPLVSVVHALRYDLHNNKLTRPFVRIIESSYIRTVDGMIFISDHTKERVQSLTMVNVPWTIAYPAGDRIPRQIDPEMLRKKANDSRPLKLLYLGAITKNKQLHLLLNAMLDFADGSFELTIAGAFHCPKSYEKKIRHLIKKVKAKQALHYAGEITKPDSLTDLFHTHHLLVLPSLSEGLPLTILEAAGFGIPSITTINSAADEFIQNDVNGILINPESKSELTSSLRTLESDPEQLLSLSMNAYRSFRHHPTWNQTGEAVEQFLTTLQKNLAYDRN